MVKRLSILIPGLAIFLLIAPDAGLGKVGSQCARLVPTSGREIIINACSTCVIVSISRKRPGIPAPVSRSFNLRAKSSIQVPFLGPGRSRITSVIPCKGEKGAAPNLVDKKPLKRKDKKCVALEKGKSGQVSLVNSCRVCKVALIERQNKSGKGKRQAYKVGAKSILPIQPKGATGVGLLAEINCPK